MPAGRLPMTASPRFFGRQSELAALTRALTDALAGHGGLVLIGGEPGIGKTRLSEQLAASATLQGARVLWGRCFEGEGTPAFWPWTEALRGYLRGCDPVGLRAQLGDGAADVARLVPAVGEVLPEFGSGHAAPATAEPPADAHGEARFRQFDAVTNFLQRVAAAQPLMIIIDDLQWADTSSLLLLEFAVRQSAQTPLLIAATYRDGDVAQNTALPQALGRLTRAPRLVRLTLGGLDEPDVAAMIEDLAGTGTAPNWAGALSRMTEGNPFFIGEMIRHLERDTSFTFGAGPVPVPPSIQDVIGLRLARLPAAGRQLLEVAAVLGREFSVRALALAGAVDTLAALDLLEQAESARLVTAAPAIDTYRFTHTLVRETLYDRLPHSRRMRLHLQVGTALESLWGDTPEQVSELAWHFSRAAPLGDSNRAVRYAWAAGVQARAMLAYEESARLFGMALDALPLGPRDDAQRCQVLIALGEARSRAGDREGARGAFREAAAISAGMTAADGPLLLARAALNHAQQGVATLLHDSVTVGLLEQAIQGLSDAHHAMRARLLAALAEALYWSDRRPEALRLSEAAVAGARAAAEPALLLSTLVSRHAVLGAPAFVEERLAIAAELVQIATTAGDPELQVQALGRRIRDLLEVGQIANAGAAIDAYTRLAAGLRQPLYRWHAAAMGAMRALLAGDLEGAEQLAQQALAFGEQAQHPEAAALYGTQVVDLWLERGQLDQVEQMLPTFEQHPGFRVGLAYLYLRLDRKENGRQVFEGLASAGFADVDLDSSFLVRIAYLAQVCHLLGDGPRAAALYALARPYAARFAVGTAAINCLGSVARYLGLLVGTMARNGLHPAGGDAWDLAAGHFDQALQANDAIGAPVYAAVTRLDYAALLLERHQSAPKHQAAGCRCLAWAGELLAAAGAGADARGLVHLHRDIDRLRGRMPQPATPATGAARHPGGLTEREMDVLRLLAAGYTNKQIADTLVLSPATVRGHTIAIYGKIGASGRAAAAAYALRHGIAPPDSG